MCGRYSDDERRGNECRNKHVFFFLGIIDNQAAAFKLVVKRKWSSGRCASVEGVTEVQPGCINPWVTLFLQSQQKQKRTFAAAPIFFLGWRSCCLTAVLVTACLHLFAACLGHLGEDWSWAVNCLPCSGELDKVDREGARRTWQT